MKNSLRVWGLEDQKLRAVIQTWANWLEQLSPFPDCCDREPAFGLRKGFNWYVHMTKTFTLQGYISVEIGIAIPELEYSDETYEDDKHGILITLQVNRNSVISHESAVDDVKSYTKRLIDPVIFRKIVRTYLETQNAVHGLLAANFNETINHSSLITTLGAEQ